MAKKTEGWTPYGLEAIRGSHLRRRRLMSLFVALGLLVLWSLTFDSTVETQLDISAEGGGSRASIDVTDAVRQREDRPLTISVDPGRVTRADTGAALEQTAATRFAAPTYERAQPLPWSYYILAYGPYVLIGLALYLLARRPPKHELNYGIYKGAMPYEMITAHAAKYVLTAREARTSIFGKGRGDHLPHEAIVVERVPQEEDA